LFNAANGGFPERGGFGMWRATLFRGEWCQSILYRKRVCGHAVSWAADRNSAGSFNGSG